MQYFRLSRYDVIKFSIANISVIKRRIESQIVVWKSALHLLQLCDKSYFSGLPVIQI